MSSCKSGLTDGVICTGGICDAGIDLATCKASLTRSCNNHVIAHLEDLLDSCSGHASPYHIHKGLGCDYDETASITHNPLIAVMLDGRGLYGIHESASGMPTDFDECDGHYGPVP